MMKQINPQKQPHKQRTVILIILVILTAFAIVMIGFLKNTVLVSYPVLKGLPEVGKWYSFTLAFSVRSFNTSIGFLIVPRAPSFLVLK